MEEEEPGGKKKKVGNYVLGRKIGEGRYATVRLATHNIAHQKVAVKVIPKKVLAQKEAARRHFRRQALLSQYVQHPNIVRLYEAMETSNSYYLVLELAERGQFCQYLAQRRCLDETEARKYVSQLVSAVDHMHMSGVVHRDLRLDNFLLDKDNNIKISGFGHGSSPSSTVHELAPVYTAPETFTGKLGGIAADIWSIGVCLYTMVTGKHPFVTDAPTSVKQIHANIIQGCTPPESLTDSCKSLLRRLLEPSEGKRITMADLLNHPWMTNDGNSSIERCPPVLKVTPAAVDFTVVKYLCTHFDFSETDLLYSVSERKVDRACAAYHLMLKGVENGFIPPGLSPRSTTPPSVVSSLNSTDSRSSQSQGQDPDRIFPEVKMAPSYDSLKWLTSIRPVSYKTSVNCLKENRRKKSRAFRPKTFDPQTMPSVAHKKPFVNQSSKEKLPDIKNKRTYPIDSPEAKYGSYGRHRDAWENIEENFLKVRGRSPVRNGGFYVSYNSLTPQIITFDPPAPPNTASGMRLKSRAKSEHLKLEREKSMMYGAVEELSGCDEEQGVMERQKSKIMCTLDMTSSKRTLSYDQPLSFPKKLSTREQRNAAIAVFKRITEQNAVRRALRWNPEVTRHSPPTPTSTSTESVERDDFLRPVIKVTISTCKS